MEEDDWDYELDPDSPCFGCAELKTVQDEWRGKATALADERDKLLQELQEWEELARAFEEEIEREESEMALYEAETTRKEREEELQGQEEWQGAAALGEDALQQLVKNERERERNWKADWEKREAWWEKKQQEWKEREQWWKRTCEDLVSAGRRFVE